MKLCIDPGHGQDNQHFGSYDGGAAAFGVEEADVCLKVGLTLKFILAEYDIDAWLTRISRGQSAPLSQRVGRAASQGCTHWVSLHMNEADGTAHGTESYYRSQEDKMWAALCQSAALQGFGLKDRGLKDESASQHSRLAVFSFAGPATLIEMGFIDKASDLRDVQQRENRIEFADALAERISKLKALEEV